MSEWANRIVGAIDRRATEGGVDNLTGPAELVSTDPPQLRVKGVLIEKNIHVDPKLLPASGGAGGAARVMSAADTGVDIMTLFEQARQELLQVPQIQGKTTALLDYLERFVTEVKKFMEEDYPLKDGDRVMVRQQGNDFYVSGRVE